MGNKADVDGNDLLGFWEDDERTKVICMYLESFGNPRRFTETARSEFTTASRVCLQMPPP